MPLGALSDHWARLQAQLVPAEIGGLFLGRIDRINVAILFLAETTKRQSV